LPNDLSEPLNFKQLAQLYMAHEVARLSQAVLARRGAHLKDHLLPLLGDTQLYDITAMRIRQFTDTLGRKGLSQAHIEQVILSLRVCLKYAVNKSWLNVLPWPKHRVQQDMPITLSMPTLSAYEFKGLYNDLIGDIRGSRTF
jgi:site-specific recombinase XerD